VRQRAEHLVLDHPVVEKRGGRSERARLAAAGRGERAELVTKGAAADDVERPRVQERVEV